MRRNTDSIGHAAVLTGPMVRYSWALILRWRSIHDSVELWLKQQNKTRPWMRQTGFLLCRNMHVLLSLRNVSRISIEDIQFDLVDCLWYYRICNLSDWNVLCYLLIDEDEAWLLNDLVLESTWQPDKTWRCSITTNFLRNKTCDLYF